LRTRQRESAATHQKERGWSGGRDVSTGAAFMGPGGHSITEKKENYASVLKFAHERASGRRLAMSAMVLLLHVPPYRRS
jgi:hypothetical protein